MSDKIAGYLPRVSFLEATEPGSLTLARLYLEMATVLDHSERLAALSLFDKADHLFAAHWQTAPDAARAGMAHSLNNRAALEINAQQWADAVDAAKQAVELRRDRLGSQTTGQNEAARLDLGYSQGALVLAFRGVGQFQIARETCGEALVNLGVFAGKKNQHAFILLAKLICLYTELCQQTGQNPDPVLLLPLAKAFYDSNQT
ncbi:tetratricopeptide repeat protein [Thalassospira alkalitolerans]|uniref:MalT-like TPR region domain-containing protein n=1 Tax=Thalassospira alkalitolerans TaxID=1293890 RepID=A0A1Y2LHF5_9PROT|nr:tetratricopeptide repeat protein [Thalassospira alkalitolerans]OSQ50365.1 hypothetical protein TALK_02635 [Thalassospira alkalitolerans]|tara:strand:+ start:26580 stop:27188 length:609 start_codon:yes stop_codon:yes gene_type:complete